MSWISRARWAASVPWSGITDKPPSSGGVTDIGQLTASGFSNGQIPIWSSSLGKFLPGSRSPSTPVTPSAPSYIDSFVEWNPPVILPLQTAWEDFPFIGATINQIISVGPPYNVGQCFVLGYVPFNDTARIQVVNLSASSVDLGDGVWRIRLTP